MKLGRNILIDDKKMDVDACIENMRLIDFIFENFHKKWKLMYELGMCHGGNQYINLIKDAFNVRNNLKYNHVSYIISYRIIFYFRVKCIQT